jgi:hypothetical protein
MQEPVIKYKGYGYPIDIIQHAVYLLNVNYFVRPATIKMAGFYPSCSLQF